MSRACSRAVARELVGLRVASADVGEFVGMGEELALFGHRVDSESGRAGVSGAGGGMNPRGAVGSAQEAVGLVVAETWPACGSQVSVRPSLHRQVGEDADAVEI